MVRCWLLLAVISLWWGGEVAAKKVVEPIVFDSTYYHLQDSLVYYSEIILQEPNDTLRLLANDRYTKTIKELLNKDNSFYFTFDALKPLSKTLSPDNRFRILCWLYPQKNGKFVYHGMIQFAPDEFGKSRVIVLEDVGNELINPYTELLRDGKWYGCVCFQIIPNRYKRNVSYTLLGWRGSMLQNEKVIDVLTFDDDDNPLFGGNMFSGFKLEMNRVLFRYKLTAHMLLQYLESKYHPQPDKPFKEGKAIVFDRLAPIDESGSSELAAMSAIVDGLYFSKGKWILTLDLLILEQRK